MKNLKVQNGNFQRSKNQNQTKNWKFFDWFFHNFLNRKIKKKCKIDKKTYFWSSFFLIGGWISFAGNGQWERRESGAESLPLQLRSAPADPPVGVLRQCATVTTVYWKPRSIPPTLCPKWRIWRKISGKSSRNFSWRWSGKFLAAKKILCPKLHFHGLWFLFFREIEPAMMEGLLKKLIVDVSGFVTAHNRRFKGRALLRALDWLIDRLIH